MSDILMKVIGDVTALRERLDNAEARAEVDARNTAGLPMYAGLTAGRVLFAGTDQALADSPGLMFNPVANALAVAGAISAGGTLVVNSLGTGGTASIEVGAGGSGNRYAFIDLTGDDTYGDYGLRILRNNSGPNATSDLSHRGAGALRFITNDGGDISLYPGSSRRLTADGSGVLIETAITQQLLVSNTQTGSGGGYSVSLFAAHPGVSFAQGGIGFNFGPLGGGSAGQLVASQGGGVQTWNNAGLWQVGHFSSNGSLQYSIKADSNGAAPRIGFLGAAPAVRQTGGAKTATATYGANEQSMLQAAYNALRTFGFLT